MAELVRRDPAGGTSPVAKPDQVAVGIVIARSE
jgi:hypothetical protein